MDPRHLLLVGIVTAHLNGCSAPPSPEEEVREIRVSVYPDGPGRVVGIQLLEHLDSVELDREGSTFSASRGDRALMVPFPPGASNPVITLRLSGPKGSIEREFVVAVTYDGPLIITAQDAGVLGVGDDAPRVALVVEGKGVESRWDVHRAVVRVSLKELGIDETFPVIWPTGADAFPLIRFTGPVTR